MASMDLARIDLNLLLAFEALMATRSVTRAAETLGLRQPAMSAALGRLRVLFSDELFTRAGGAMRPSPKAERIAPAVAAALDGLRAALGPETAFDPAAERRSVTLALTDYATAVLGPPLIAALRAAAPGVTLRIVGYDKGSVGALVDQGRVDLAVGVFPDPPERLVVTTLFQERFIGLARTGHPVHAPGLDAAAYAAFDHALVTVAQESRGAIDAALAARGLRRRVVLILPQFLALPDLLAASNVVAAVPERLARRLCGRDGLATFPIPLALRPWPLHMLWSPLARSDGASAWLRAQMVAAAERDPVDGRR